jgi:urease accessory protein
MKACARIVAEPDGRGGTRLVELRGDVPLLPRRTGPGEVHLVGGAAGPLGGDQLRLEIQVRAGARLTVRTVAATVALPGRGRSTLHLDLDLGPGASLSWLPEPLVAAAGCDHHSVSTVELDPTARLVFREEIIAGRHAERPGDLVSTVRVRRGGSPLFAQELAIGPRADGYDGPAVLGGAKAAGSLLLVEPGLSLPRALPVQGGAILPLTGPAVLATALATDAHTLRTVIDPDTTRQRVLHSIETYGDCTDPRPATAAGRA